MPIRRSAATILNRRCHIAILALLLSGCVNPVQKDIVKFGEAAGVLAGTTSDIYARHRALVDQNNLEQAIIEYVDPQKTSFNFPPPPVVTELGQVSWASRIEAVNGIGLYAKALADVNDPAATAQAQAGLQSVATGISGFPNVNLPPQTGSLVANLVVAAIRANNAAQLRRSIEQTQPMIEAAANALEGDFTALQTVITLDSEAWVVDAADKLEILKRDHRTSAAELQEAYRLAVAQQVANENLKNSYGQNVRAIEKFAAAHADLISSEDGDRALDDFLGTTQSLAQDFAAIRNGEGQ